LSETPNKRGLGLVIYGIPGIGKTSFAAQFPGPVQFFSMKESGFDDLNDVGEIPEWCSNENLLSWESFIVQFRKCTAKTIVIDSLSGFQQLLFRYVTDKFYDGDVKKFSAYYNGPRTDAPAVLDREWEALATAKRNMGCHIILLGHAKTDMIPNALGTDYQAHIVDLDKGIGGFINKWAQAVLFMGLDIEAARNNRGQMTNKAQNTDERVMYTNTSPGHAAKSRGLKLPNPILLGDSAEQAFKAFWSKIPAVYK